MSRLLSGMKICSLYTLEMLLFFHSVQFNLELWTMICQRNLCLIKYMYSIYITYILYFLPVSGCSDLAHSEVKTEVILNSWTKQ